MVSFLRQNITIARLLQLWAELAIVFGAVLLALHYVMQLPAPALAAAPTALVFAVVLVALNGAFGIYRRVEPLSSGPYLLRMLLAAFVGIPLAFLIDALMPGGGRFGENVALVLVLALGLSLVRHV